MGKYLLQVCQRELNLRNTLINGQCFNWTEVADNLFSGVLFQQYLEIRREDPSTIQVEVYPDKTKDFKKKLQEYFNLSINLQKLETEWSADNAHIRNICQRIPGIRILRQDPWQCTISFITSSNNHITRITQLLFKLREKYGKFIIEKHNKKHFGFPILDDLKKAKVQELRELGFGYRAEYIVEAVGKIAEKGGEKWLEDLRDNNDYEHIKKQLIGFNGIGRKVADCISLFSMDCHSSVPVDTHIFNIAKKLGFIKFDFNKKSLSESIYKKISEAYFTKFGKYSGWAQQILFAGDLKMFKDKMDSATTTTQTKEEQPEVLKPVRRKK